MGRCAACGEYGVLDGHRCPPRWSVDFGDDFVLEVHASSAKNAAAQAVEQQEHGSVEYPVLSGEPQTVTIDGKRYKVFGESVPEYWAEELEEKVGPE